MEKRTIKGFRREHELFSDEVLMIVHSPAGAFTDEFVCHETAAAALLALNDQPEVLNYFRPFANGKGMGCC